jgi:hypothetical protein
MIYALGPIFPIDGMLLATDNSLTSAPKNGPNPTRLAIYSTLNSGTRMNRRTLHELVERIPEEELSAAQRFLEYLAVSPAYRAALSAPPDDESVTDGDVAAIARTQEEVRLGKLVPHDDILREFGLR